jgi:hypothetical protein
MQIEPGWGSREAGMLRSLPKRAIAWLADLLGPPPPPPRRYFSKAWDERARRRVRLAMAAPGAIRKMQSLDALGGQETILEHC